MTRKELPSLVGYPLAEAERLATAQGWRVTRVDAAAPPRLSPHREARVGRQRVGADGAVELLGVWVPAIPQAGTAGLSDLED